MQGSRGLKEREDTAISTSFPPITPLSQMRRPHASSLVKVVLAYTTTVVTEAMLFICARGELSTSTATRNAFTHLISLVSTTWMDSTGFSWMHGAYIHTISGWFTAHYAAL